MNGVQEVFIQLSAGEYATCGVNLNEKVRCWGDMVPNPSESLSFLQVSCGRYHCCGILQAGGVHCWGELTLLTSAVTMCLPLQLVTVCA
jgi:hypothetical protein